MVRSASFSPIFSALSAVAAKKKFETVLEEDRKIREQEKEFRLQELNIRERQLEIQEKESQAKLDNLARIQKEQETVLAQQIQQQQQQIDQQQAVPQVVTFYF